MYADRLSQCRDAFERVVRDGREGGAIALGIQARLQICLGDWQTGRWDEALGLADEGNALSEEHRYWRYTFILGGYIKATFSEPASQTAAVKTAARELTDWARDTGGGAAETLAIILAVSAIGDEDFEHAYLEASAISPAGEFAPLPPALWVLFDLVEAAVKTDRLAEAQAHVAVMRERRIGEISTRLALVVAGCGALTVPPEHASTMFDEALATRASRWPFDLARVKLAYAEHLRRTHAPVDAAVHLRDALHTFQELGARPWRRRAAAELRAVGLPPQGHHFRRRHAECAGPRDRHVGGIGNDQQKRLRNEFTCRTAPSAHTSTGSFPSSASRLVPPCTTPSRTSAASTSNCESYARCGIATRTRRSKNEWEPGRTRLRLERRRNRGENRVRALLRPGQEVFARQHAVCADHGTWPAPDQRPEIGLRRSRRQLRCRRFYQGRLHRARQVRRGRPNRHHRGQQAAPLRP